MLFPIRYTENTVPINGISLRIPSSISASNPNSAYSAARPATSSFRESSNACVSRFSSIIYTSISPFISLGSRRSRASCNTDIDFVSISIFLRIGVMNRSNASKVSLDGITIRKFLKFFLLISRKVEPLAFARISSTRFIKLYSK